MRVFVLVSAFVAAAWPVSCQAYVEHLRIPLTGHRNFSTGRGSVSFSEGFGDVDEGTGIVLIVEVINVPLPPGTELEVRIHEKEVGRLTLDKQRRGRLVLNSKENKMVPRLTTGSLVSVKLPGGSTVLW